MELLYFISGILSMGIVYSIVLLKKNQSNYHDALARLQSHQNISSLRHTDVVEKVDGILGYIKDVENKMEKDQYSSVSEINKKVGELGEMASAINVRVSQNQKILETSISKTTTEINTLKNNLKQLSQNPNFIR